MVRSNVDGVFQYDSTIYGARITSHLSSITSYVLTTEAANGNSLRAIKLPPGANLLNSDQPMQIRLWS